jgi:hypothetical protein
MMSILKQSLWVTTVVSVVVSSCLAFTNPNQSASHTTITTSKTRSLSPLFATASSMLPEGIIKTVTTPGNENRRVNLGDIATVKYSCYVPEQNQKPFAKATKQKVVRSFIYFCGGTTRTSVHRSFSRISPSHTLLLRVGCWR